MEEFNTSLVREKIIFSEGGIGEGDAKEPVVIRSNRIYLKLDSVGHSEKIVIRAQNMHTTLRVAAKILSSFYSDGPLMGRATPIRWESQWEESVSTYEREYNTHLWGAIYVNGKS